MHPVLVPCPSCARHVQCQERACPFCSQVLPEDLASRAVPDAPRRLGRAAAFVFATTVVVAVGAPSCAEKPSARSPDPPATMTMASYGGPAYPDTPPSSSCDDAGAVPSTK